MSKEFKAFGAASMVATIVHAVMWVVQMGRPPLAYVTVVPLMALVGIPVAAAATLLLGVPVYLLVRRTIGVSLASAIVGGALVGLIVSALYLVVDPPDAYTAAMSPLHGLFIGVSGAVVWWRLVTGRWRRGSL